jgi:hypothetical protein
MRREDDTLSARRKSVSNRSTVGKTLNSTGRPMYMATIITITDIMRSSTMRMSSMKLGSGVMSAMTISNTAMGTASSPALERPTEGILIAPGGLGAGAGLLMARA